MAFITHTKWIYTHIIMYINIKSNLYIKLLIFLNSAYRSSGAVNYLYDDVCVFNNRHTNTIVPIAGRGFYDLKTRRSDEDSIYKNPGEISNFLLGSLS